MSAPQVAFSHAPFHRLALLDLYGILCLRDEVFVVQQRITAEAEADGRDPECVHVIGRDATGRVVATARVFLGRDPAKVGRIAVHPALQGRGVGTRLMDHVHALLGDHPAAMSAQAHLRGWYERLGWRAEGPPYDEAGIPHLRMTRVTST